MKTLYTLKNVFALLEWSLVMGKNFIAWSSARYYSVIFLSVWQNLLLNSLSRIMPKKKNKKIQNNVCIRIMYYNNLKKMAILDNSIFADIEWVKKISCSFIL